MFNANFQKMQKQITAYLRDPDNAPLPADLDPERLSLYKDLVFNNLDSILQSTFPVTHDILNEDLWHNLIRDFLKNHQAHTPLFHKIPEEFLYYLEHERDNSLDPPYLYELMHYEWVELAVELLDVPPPNVINAETDLLKGKPIISPLAWILQYNYPVHKIGPNFLPSKKEATFLIVYRNAEDEVQFTEINMITAKLLELIKHDPDITGLKALEKIAKELQHPQPEMVITEGLKILEDLQQQEIILSI